MDLEQLKQQKILLEQKHSELSKVNLKPIHSQIGLRRGLMSGVQRQQDEKFRELVKGQKEDASKKISSITQLIEQKESEPEDDLFFPSSSSKQVNDFSILPTPKKKKIRRRGRIQQNMGWFLE